MKPNNILNFLWKLPTVFWHYVIYELTGYVFAARIKNDNPIVYYFERYHQLPEEFRGIVPK